MGKLNDTALRRIKATGKIQKMTDGQVFIFMSQLRAVRLGAMIMLGPINEKP